MDNAGLLSIGQASSCGDAMVAVGGVVTSAGEPSSTETNSMAMQRKITLLTRPTLPVASPAPNTSPGSPGAVGSVMTGADSNPLISDLQQNGNSGALSSGALPTPGRAARNDYYDTEDPSVNLHEFIVNSLQAQKNRVVLLKLEEEFLTYVTDPKRVEPLKLPPWDSYHRMLAHRVAAYFGLEHNVDPTDKSCVVVCKGPQTRVPVHRFSDFLTVETDAESAEPKLILKRAGRGGAVALNKSFEALSTLQSDVKSFEQREEEYEKVRARIFSQHQPLQGSHSSITFDLGSAPQRTRSSLLPAIMQHRRTVSDTLLFRRPSVLDDLKKDGPNSSHSSRSATPLLALLQPVGGEGGVVGQGLGQQPAAQKVVASQHSPQQQKLPSRQLPSSQVAQAAFPQPQPHSQQQNKFIRQRPVNVLSFPVQRGVPVFYPQQTAIMADPNWYYNNLMLYQQFVPATAAATPQYGHAQVLHPTVFPVNHQYPISPPSVPTAVPGMVPAAPQPQIVSPPISTRPAPHMRLPILSPPGATAAAAAAAVVEGLPPSPSQQQHPSSGPSVTLVRPVAQAAAPTRGSFKFESGPVAAAMVPPHPHRYPLAAQPPGDNLLLSGQGPQPQRGTAAVMGVTQPAGQQQLMEQMEQLSLRTLDEGEISKGGGGQQHMEGAVAAMGVGSKAAGHKLGPAGHHGEGGGGGGKNGKSVVVNGSFPQQGYAMVPTAAMEAVAAGQMVSPTQGGPPGAVQFLPAHMQPHLLPGAQDTQLVSPQHVLPGTPGGVVHFPSTLSTQSPSAPSTPPVGHFGFSAIPSMLSAQQPQSVFSPPSTGVTHSPVQILGHSLGTSLFSPPPPSSTAHQMFVNSPSSAGKILGYPSVSPAAHAPVGSGLRFRRFDSPNKQVGVEVPAGVGVVTPPQSQSGASLPQVQFVAETPVPPGHKPNLKPSAAAAHSNGNGGSSLSGSSGFQLTQLPPRLASQQQAQQTQRVSGTRYQNQRHPANRPAQVNKAASGGSVVVTESGQFLKKEPLLPTPPSAQMVKLDTSLTCGVPLNVMEIVSLPPDGTAERQIALQILRELGAQEFRGGKINKTGEEVLIATFPSPNLAIKALQTHNVPFTLSIPRNNHAKFILSLLQNLQNISVQ